MKILLASNSPRRAQLLQQIGCQFDLIDVDVCEINDHAISPEQIAVCNARAKAGAGAKAAGNAKGDVVIAADTIVVLDGQVFGKPRDKADAACMLRKLSGRKHKVLTAVAVCLDNTVYHDICSTQVSFSQLSERDICRYLDTEEPMDKAGAYGIQGIGAMFVEAIEGCYFNVMGLPLYMLRRLLKEVKIEIF